MIACNNMVDLQKLINADENGLSQEWFDNIDIEELFGKL